MDIKICKDDHIGAKSRKPSFSWTKDTYMKTGVLPSNFLLVCSVLPTLDCFTFHKMLALMRFQYL